MSHPGLLRFGTSSWAYEGWQGLVYRNPYPKHRFAKDCLAEYAAYEYRGARLFQTVGLDHSFYRPPSVPQLAHYAAQVPDGFLICPKVWEELTIRTYADHPRYGAKAGKDNQRFLDAELFEEMVRKPTLEGLADHAGPFIFEFQRHGLDPPTFLPVLDQFLDKLPRGSYAVEVRDPAVLSARYSDILRAHGVAHVYNHWTSMPPLAAQHAALGRTFPAGFSVFRLLTPIGLAHAEAVRRYAPYRTIAKPQPEMRADVLALIRQAQADETAIYVLVNNRAEGNAPMTVQALVDGLADHP